MLYCHPNAIDGNFETSYCFSTNPYKWFPNHVLAIWPLTLLLVTLQQLTVSVSYFYLRGRTKDVTPWRRTKKHARSHGWVRNRLRKQVQRPPLPSNLLVNAQSLKNKLDDLRARLIFQWDVRDCSILRLSPLLLHPSSCRHRYSFVWTPWCA